MQTVGNAEKDPGAEAPIFIIGTERSGTNLLRLMLDAHPDIAVPHPPHILKNFFDLEPLYGDLGVDSRFMTLINDVLGMIALHPYPWRINLDADTIFQSCRDRSLVSIFFAIYDQYSTTKGKQRWACKSTFMIRHVALVRRYFQSAKFIYLVRDGRDVAASARETIFNHYSAYYSACLWRQEQRDGIHWLEKLGDKEILLVKYEELVHDPEITLRSLCTFLDVQFHPEMLEYFKTEEAKRSGALSEAWRNTAKPVQGESVGRFRRVLSEGDIALFETLAREELLYFSYPLKSGNSESEAFRCKNSNFRLWYLLEETARMIRVQSRYLFRDRNNILRYKKYWYLRWLRMRRAWN